MPKTRAPDRTNLDPAAAPPAQADVERAIEAALQRLRPRCPAEAGRAPTKDVPAKNIPAKDLADRAATGSASRAVKPAGRARKKGG
ncbi:hypothetical protein [Methylobacterium oxalidis]|uniref:Uncharacterized protein n=1 Tax=Methylobacterium oxalidis TaxID=944322 RepID=A0A512J106_9HYPH|nr:hypothetical protein [Methylobacterium oxalidis]GEP03658.1 hypothetical protein MOX02_16960 [Methylobacterium oxalidis]GJE34365.1 hypothetical protein LDDCCGHA_4576 [Methylobacterium oxalidis]GLS64985.1 hypothetical protein GCM10007888_33660 [Methylobacterium oxalidis]